ncbi:glycosyl hydrolase 115 family protein [Pedobacter duraquae]|uniref:Glycosyl hydrolase family 115 (Putative glucuronidase) n=1 Tax=Pedobacter duraquae TaxID=425511 RepID=A0A4R6IKS4_9SPHI|nr:glycosyl hydrolase 115 family protein [Pedobacter duraquae]TDO22700.1 glycosyl hydrolase family 115 (putative glucuronidase) [Pedobacter duraquae]
MKKYILFFALFGIWTASRAAGLNPITSSTFVPGSFPLIHKGKVATIIASSNEWPGVLRAAKDLQTDLGKVSGVKPMFSTGKANGMPIIVGTIGHSAIIDELIRNTKINVGGIAGNWESTLIQVVKNPVKGVDSALVIAGSDKRGTIYGIYELSYQIGVSPWYYWADVPIQKSSALYILEGRHIISSPAVKYRGIFLNDEAPALSGWSKKEFGGFNHKFYEKVFELILRLKGNYLWPAMWGSAFNDDDKMNPILADEYGVVMGTSHHEPMVRSQTEWKRFGKGQWNYENNKEVLTDFWRKGIQNMGNKESLITIGMRGDGDEPMTEGTATALLERIVKDQRQTIEQVTKKPASETPQLWALYKEVQDYYDNGMRVPDDVTLLLCDDNWGNIRKLPRIGEAPRSGGYGIYYHFDYVGGPRNYKWLNTNPIQKVWEQMNLAYRYDANQIWIVNVGDLKPMEFPIEFFLDYAWAPNAIPAEQLMPYTMNWAAKQFGKTHATAIGQIIDTYLKYSGRIKPELLNANTYSLVNYREFERVTSDFKKLNRQADNIYQQIPKSQKDAFYQLVLHPVEAVSNLYALYFAQAKNRLYAKQGRVATNALAAQVDSLFKRDAKITNYYNTIMAGGKWDHMMDQTHIGYTYWQQPEKNIIPKTTTIQPGQGGLGISIEGSDASWTGKATVDKSFPVFSSLTNKTHDFEIFNTGTSAFRYSITAPSFVSIEEKNGTVTTEKTVSISIDWSKAPTGNTRSEIIISGTDGSIIQLPINTDNTMTANIEPNLFLPENGYIAMEAPNYSRAINNRPIFWQTIPNYGKTLGGVMPVPVTAPIQQPSETSPALVYEIYLTHTGTFTLNTFVSPTIDFTGKEGLQFAVSVDDEAPIVVNISSGYKSDNAWGQSVANGIKIFKTPFQFNKTGKHTIKYMMVNPGVVLQKLVLDLGGLKPSFLGPPESTLSTKNNN